MNTANMMLLKTKSPFHLWRES